MSFNHDGTLLAVCGENAQLVLVDAVLGNVLATVETKYQLNAVALHPFEKVVVITHDDRSVAQILREANSTSYVDDRFGAPPRDFRQTQASYSQVITFD